MSDTSRTAGTSDPSDTGSLPPEHASRLTRSIHLLVPGAACIRAHRTPSGRYLASVLDACGHPISMPPQDTTALGRWLATGFPSAAWETPHVYDVATGTLTPAETARGC
ncbi:hypothetical protein [Streptomyces sp. SID3343]|uniref:hypothetical protein n=1 Tax=Streptomyces sp. SID3343 TaxID=2690260 RepID=UPI00136DC662|nr:hypothetical protein [Streptomyces sp. SID3343]MYV97627.1 hypothetical protein [Streptomyces sp. SID3343]